MTYLSKHIRSSTVKKMVAVFALAITLLVGCNDEQVGNDSSKLDPTKEPHNHEKKLPPSQYVDAEQFKKNKESAKTESDRIRSAKSVELFSIVPEYNQDAYIGGPLFGKRNDGTPTLRGHPIHQRATTDNPLAIRILADSVEELMSAKADLWARCFYPRHGIVVDGKSVLVCFECGLVYVDDEAYSMESHQTGRDRLQAVWAKHGLDTIQKKKRPDDDQSVPTR